jgi:hypothetical protein
MSLRNFISLKLLFMAPIFLAACAPLVDLPDDNVQDDQEAIGEVILEPQGALFDELFYDSEEDCLADEIYDPVERLCYIEYECLDEEDCADLEGSFLDDLIEIGEGMISGVLDPASSNFNQGEEQTIITYDVEGNVLSNPEPAEVSEDLNAYQNDTATHHKIWSYFASLIPVENRAFVSEFVVFTDGPEEGMAAVEQDIDNPRQWILAVDILDAENTEELTYTLIHEYGHLLTLNPEQVPPNIELFNEPEDEDLYQIAEDACSTYFTGEGCSLSNSYIHSFYSRYWDDLYEEWLYADSQEDDDAYYQALDDFYFKYEDRFVSDYAPTNPGEDIAESWTHFVLHAKPAGNSEAEQKILFFYDYPELVQLRAAIISRTTSRLRRQ